MSTHHESSTDLPLPKQEFVGNAYEHLDTLRAPYQDRQGCVHPAHRVSNAQGWTECEALPTHLGEMAARLRGVEERLVFDRLDMADHSTRHVSRLSLFHGDGTPLLVDWYAPAAHLFYQATSAEPDGVVRRRYIFTHDRRVTDLGGELLDASSASRLELQGEDTLMHALNEARDGRMGDIVATIQSGQDRIIRASDKGLLVIQGGPGTGKTAVVLHRIAYLLYVYHERLECSGVLLVGPSHLFLRYIEQVLPSLGGTGVVSVILGDLVSGMNTRGGDGEAVTHIKGLPAWAEIVEEAVRTPARLPNGGQALRVWNRLVTLTCADVETVRRQAKHSGHVHNVARESFTRELMDVLALHLAREAGGADSEGDIDPGVRRSQLIEICDSVDCRRAVNTAWMSTSVQTLLRRLYARPRVLATASREAGSPLRLDELAALVRPRPVPWTVSDVPILDECEELLGPMPSSSTTSRKADEGAIKRARKVIEAQNLGEDIVTTQVLAERVAGQDTWTPLSEATTKGRTQAYGRIVIDEAQELSPMAWRALLRRCPLRSFTVVGDLGQRRGSKRPPTQEKALGSAARALAIEYTLTISYHTPAMFTTLAEGVVMHAGVPVLYPMTAVRDVEDYCRVTHVDTPRDAPASSPKKNSPLWRATAQAQGEPEERPDHEAGTSRGRIASVVGKERARAWGADVDDETTLSGRVCLLSAMASKGLGLGSIILAEPAEVLGDGVGNLFVTLARATHDMYVAHCAPLPASMEE